jgi:hypothetical protein
MGMPFWRRMQARLNILPVLSLPVNVIGLPTGLYALYLALHHRNPFGFWLIALSVLNIGLYCVTVTIMYVNAWRRTAFVLSDIRLRVWYLIRVNPVSLFIYHTMWTIPIVLGFLMFLANLGKTWIRTQKFDADHRIAAEGAAALTGRLSAIPRPDAPRPAQAAIQLWRWPFGRGR